jgi:hypothetical protein
MQGSGDRNRSNSPGAGEAGRHGYEPLGPKCKGKVATWSLLPERAILVHILDVDPVVADAVILEGEG